MNIKNLIALFVLTALFVVGAWFAAFKPAPTPAPASGASQTSKGDRLAPALTERATDAARITITSGDSITELALEGDTWTVATKAGYPAQPDRVRRLMTTLSELRAVESKTSKPELHSRLSLNWPDETKPGQDEFSPRPTLVHISDTAGDDIAAIVLGATKFIGSDPKQYARLLAENQTWLTSGKIDTPTNAMGWLNARFIELPRDSVQSVTITHPNSETLRLTRDAADADFTIADIPDGMTITNTALANNTGYALAFVNFTDVDLPGEPQPDPVSAEFTTFDGLKITLAINQIREQGKTVAGWVTASAAGPESEAINDQFEAFRFQLPLGIIESLTRKPSDLLEEFDPQEAGPAMPGPGLPPPD